MHMYIVCYKRLCLRLLWNVWEWDDVEFGGGLMKHVFIWYEEYRKETQSFVLMSLYD